jgi:ATP-dependent DNA ligase
VPSTPKFVRPCIPTTAKAIPRGDDWLHEAKLDGYRFQIVKDGRLLRLYSKSGSDWTKRLSLLAEALAGVRSWSAVIDAELVFPNSEGHPDFRALQAAIGDPARHHHLAVFAFDLLHRDGTDLRPIPLIERRLQLSELVAVPVCIACTWCRGSTTEPSFSRRPSGTGWRASFPSARRQPTVRDHPAIGSRSRPRPGERRTGAVATV